MRLKLSPNVRLRMTVQQEMALDTDGVIFNEELYQKYLRMHAEALKRQEGLLKTTVLADAALALILFGKNVTIPGTSIGLQDIPAATEVFTVLAAFGFLMLSLSFLNAQCYVAIVEQFNIRKAKPYYIDPDFLNAADTFTEIYLKAFRANLNVHGIDFYEAGKGYKIYYTVMTGLLLLAMISLMALHFTVVGYGVWASLSDFWFTKLFAGSIVLISIVSVLVNLFIGFSFNILGENESGSTSESSDIPRSSPSASS